jgi:succinate dehydrogenase / fumarate reductase flavoprotein subunit
MGGLWVDYDLMSTIPGLFVIGEANFSDHGANRLGASALMQGLADGYFILPYTIGDYLARLRGERPAPDHPACRAVLEEARARIARLLGCCGRRSAASLHRELGRVTWEACGMSRNAAGLRAAIERVAELRERFWHDLLVPGEGESQNQALETAGRVVDFLELAELMCRDALERDESCGGHFREEHQTEDGEARRDDERFSHVAVWEHTGDDRIPRRRVEPLIFEYVRPTQRSYK